MKNIGKVERIQGEVYLCKIDPDSVKLGELPSNEAVIFMDTLEIVSCLIKVFN